MRNEYNLPFIEKKLTSHREELGKLEQQKIDPLPKLSHNDQLRKDDVYQFVKYLGGREIASYPELLEKMNQELEKQSSEKKEVNINDKSIKIEHAQQLKEATERLIEKYTENYGITKEQRDKLKEKREKIRRQIKDIDDLSVSGDQTNNTNQHIVTISMSSIVSER